MDQTLHDDDRRYCEELNLDLNANITGDNFTQERDDEMSDVQSLAEGLL